MIRTWRLTVTLILLLALLCACTPVPPKPVPAPPEPEPVEEKLPETPPKTLPDPAGFLRLEYPAQPVFTSREQTAVYMLHQLLQGRQDMTFYLDRSIGDDWDGYCLLDEAQESIRTYYLFGAYSIDTMEARDLGDPQGLQAHFVIHHAHDDYDQEARAAAWSYVRDNPPPRGGFTDYGTEQEYARRIHDFLACKVTYDPIGNDQERMNEVFDYEGLQEAYNVLGEDQHTAVCSAYARAFALIAQYAGINAVWVRGNHQDDGSSHAWNVVYPCDGSVPVTVDVTWDDNDSADEPGQVAVSDTWFYCPAPEDGSHQIEERMIRLLDHVNGISVGPSTLELPPGTEAVG